MSATNPRVGDKMVVRRKLPDGRIVIHKYTVVGTPAEARAASDARLEARASRKRMHELSANTAFAIRPARGNVHAKVK